MIEKIMHNNIMLGFIIRDNFYMEGSMFFTPGDLSLQLAYMNHPASKIIQSHIHNRIKREVDFTREVLIIKKGRIRIDFYLDQKQFLESKILETGDIAFLSEGGHGIYILENTQFFEVKQGPYAGEKDKTHFEIIQSS